MSNSYGSLLHDENKDAYRVNSYSDSASKKSSVKYTAIAIGVFQLLLFMLYGVTGAKYKLTSNADFSIGYTLFIVSACRI